MQNVILEIQIDHFGKQYRDAFFPLLEHRFALKTIAQLKTDDSIWHCNSEEPRPWKAFHSPLSPPAIPPAPACSVIPAAAGPAASPRPPRTASTHPKEPLPGGWALAKGTLQRDQENMETRFIRHAWSGNNGTASCCFSFLTFRRS